MSKYIPKFFLHSRYITFYPEVAARIGTQETIVLQQLIYWLLDNNTAGITIRGEKYIYNTYEDWQKNHFCHISIVTVKRTFLNLEKLGYIKSKRIRINGYGVTKCYSVNFDKIAELESEIEESKLRIPDKQTKIEYEIIDDESEETDQNDPQETLDTDQNDTQKDERRIKLIRPLITETTLTETTIACDFSDEKSHARAPTSKKSNPSDVNKRKTKQFLVSIGGKQYDFSWLNSNLRPLAYAFLEKAGTVYYPTSPSKRKLWYRELNDWHRMGAKPIDIHKAIADMRKEKLRIGDVQSITKILRSNLSNVSCDYVDWEDLGYERV